MMMKISKREKEILNLIAYEYTAKEIAQKLFISTHTVDTHRKNLQEKMDVRNTAGIIRKAFENGILQVSRPGTSVFTFLVISFVLTFMVPRNISAQSFVSGQSDIEYNEVFKPGLTIQNKATSLITSSNLSVYNNANYRLDFGVRSSTFTDGFHHSYIQSWYNRPLDFYTGDERRMSIDSFGRVNILGDNLLPDTIVRVATAYAGKKDVIGLSSIIFPDGEDSNWGAGGVFHGGWRGIRAVSKVGIGLEAISTRGDAIFSASTDGNGIFAVSSNAYGAQCASVDTFGVFSTSTNDHGIVGRTSMANKAGVYGYSDDVSGVGVHGVSSITVGVRGESPFGVGVYGSSTDEAGVVGSSTDGHGVDARSTNDHGIIAATLNSAKYDFKAEGAGMDYGAGSSRRWKSNIQNIANPLEMIAQLRGVRYDWDMEHGGGRHDIGFIAEEVGEVLPEIVNYEENGIDAIAMDYTKVPALLVEAINAMRDMYDDKIGAMQQELDSMVLTINELKSNSVTQNH